MLMCYATEVVRDLEQLTASVDPLAQSGSTDGARCLRGSSSSAASDAPRSGPTECSGRYGGLRWRGPGPRDLQPLLVELMSTQIISTFIDAAIAKIEGELSRILIELWRGVRPKIIAYLSNLSFEALCTPAGSYGRQLLSWAKPIVGTTFRAIGSAVSYIAGIVTTPQFLTATVVAALLLSFCLYLRSQSGPKGTPSLGTRKRKLSESSVESPSEMPVLECEWSLDLPPESAPSLGKSGNPSLGKSVNDLVKYLSKHPFPEE